MGDTLPRVRHSRDPFGVRSEEVTRKIGVHLDRFVAFVIEADGHDRTGDRLSRDVLVRKQALVDQALVPAAVNNHFASLSAFTTWVAARAPTGKTGGESVIARFDSRCLAEVRAFHRDRFLCRAVCEELTRQTVSLPAVRPSPPNVADEFQAPLPPPDQEPPVLASRARSSTSAREPLRPPTPATFLITKEMHRLAEFCDACQCFRSIGHCHGPSGAEKSVPPATARWVTTEVVEATREGFVIGWPPRRRGATKPRKLPPQSA